jgi:glycine cleavage system H protein
LTGDSTKEERQMNPKEYKYTQEHEWICPEPENKGKVGITDYAQSQLGDVVFVDLPPPGSQVEQLKKMGEIESVKAVSDLFAPVSGRVLEINHAVINEPALVNQDPYGDGWLVRLELSNPSELDALMDSDKYDEFVSRLNEEGSE